MILWYYDTMIIWSYVTMILCYYATMLLWYYDTMKQEAGAWVCVFIVQVHRWKQGSLCGKCFKQDQVGQCNPLQNHLPHRNSHSNICAGKSMLEHEHRMLRWTNTESLTQTSSAKPPTTQGFSQRCSCRRSYAGAAHAWVAYDQLQIVCWHAAFVAQPHNHAGYLWYAPGQTVDLNAAAIGACVVQLHNHAGYLQGSTASQKVGSSCTRCACCVVVRTEKYPTHGWSKGGKQCCVL